MSRIKDPEVVMVVGSSVLMLLLAIVLYVIGTSV